MQKPVEEESLEQKAKKKYPSRQKKEPTADPFYGVKVDLPPEQQLEQAWLALEASAAKWEQIDQNDPTAVAVWARYVMTACLKRQFPDLSSREENTYRKSINKPSAFDPTLPLMPLVSIHTGRDITGFPLCLKDIYTYRRKPPPLFCSHPGTNSTSKAKR
jgi:hypothetical protein